MSTSHQRTLAALVDEVRTLSAQVAVLSARVAALEGSPSSSDDSGASASSRHSTVSTSGHLVATLDAVRLAQLLPALAAAVEDRAFSAAEVLRHATVDADLAAALVASRIDSARSLGQWLRTVESQPVGPIRVTRIGADRDGAIWRCEVVS